MKGFATTASPGSSRGTQQEVHPASAGTYAGGGAGFESSPPSPVSSPIDEVFDEIFGSQPELNQERARKTREFRAHACRACEPDHRYRIFCEVCGRSL